MYNQSVYSGFYRCVARNSLAVIASRLVNVLAIFDSEDTFVDVQDGVAIRGNTAILRCVYRGDNAEFTWIRDDGLLISPQQQHNDRYQVLTTGELLIHKTNMADKERTYRCRVQDTITNRILVSAKPATAYIVDLQNEVPPRVELVPKEVSRGSSSRPINVPCVFSGNPTPNVTFFVREGRKKLSLANNPTYTIEYNVLTFRPTHETVVECRAKNSLGEYKAEIQIIAPKERIQISLDPPHQVIDILTTATFKCRTNASYASIVWMHNGKAIDSSSRFTIYKSKEGSSLTIHRVTMANSGIYQCFVSTTALVQVAQASAELNVLGTQPIFFETFKSAVLEEGHSLMLSCKAKGIPAPSIEWFVDGIRYSNVPDLTIPRVDVSNAGFYTCVATNELGSNSHTARVDIYAKIQRKVATRSMTVTQGSRVEVFCSFAGYPIDSVIWMKDGVRLNSSSRHMLRENGILVIDQLQAPADGGEYICTVEGPSGTITSKTVLDFKVPPQIDTHFFPNKIEVEESSRARLLCSVSKGDTPIRISWMRHGKILDTVPEGSVQYSDDSAMIKFKKVRFDDRGEYTCFAANQVSSVNQTTIVNVLVAPRWTLNFVQINITYAIQGRAFRVDCPAEGYPTPVVSWSKSADGSMFNEILISRRVSVHANGSLIFRSVFADTDAGFYRCEARNGVGLPKKMTTELRVERGPQFSEIYQTISVERGAHLTAFAHLAITGNQAIKTKFFYERNFQTFICEPQRCKLTINGSNAVNLTIKETRREDSALYTFKAQNGFGDDHTYINVIVQEPPESPRELAVYEVFGRNATLRWNQPLFDGNSAISSYIIQYKPHMENMGHSFSSVEINGTSLRAVLGPLEPIQQYECRIASRNALGQSDFTDSIIFTTKEEPPSGSPTAIAIHATGSQSLKVTWRAPPKGDQNGVILGYYIGYRLADSIDDAYQFKTTHASQNNTFESTYLTNLRRQTRYLIVVKAFNRAGVGPPSEELIAQTLETAPPTSPSIDVESVSATSVIIRWNPNQLAPNTDYSLNYASDKNDWRKLKLSVDQATHVVSGLACGTSYRFYVIASNSLGTGEPGVEVQIRTQGRPPVSPHKQFIVPNTTSATLLLDAWRSTGCPINAFNIQYRKRGNRNWYITGDTMSGSSDRYTIAQLSPSTTYEVKVVATSDAGPTSQDYQFTTLPIGVTSLESSLQDYSASSTMAHNRYTTIIVQVSLTIAITGGIFLLCALALFWYKKKSQVTNSVSTPQLVLVFFHTRFENARWPRMVSQPT
ncbi:Down syndrome cell adhesion molecule-like protein Dscam2 [Varroa jacobsoni]|uniref:Down syndrome cell adhesion molecule-like protein Dscam2 n=1 Tax=Varroa jacobsoni TaxID=62625 RepID=UPI000BF7BB19|nr:Down syndrome cell adhesion molecule-like protein Dscam2 [Varroa jacobsoni]